MVVAALLQGSYAQLVDWSLCALLGKQALGYCGSGASIHQLNPIDGLRMNQPFWMAFDSESLGSLYF